MVLIKRTCLVTNCAISLSPVEITVSIPSSSACFAKVPITSSASTPGMTNKGKPIAVIISCNGAICVRRSSGIGGRFALYSGYISLRKVLPFASKIAIILPFG